MSHDGLIHPAKDCADQIAALEAQNRTLRDVLLEMILDMDHEGKTSPAKRKAEAALAATEPKP